MINYCDYKERRKRSAKTFFKKTKRKNHTLGKEKEKEIFFSSKANYKKASAKKKVLTK